MSPHRDPDPRSKPTNPGTWVNVVPRDYTVDPKRWAFRMNPYDQGINMENPHPAEWCQDMMMVEPFDYEDEGVAHFYIGWPRSFKLTS